MSEKKVIILKMLTVLNIVLVLLILILKFLKNNIVFLDPIIMANIATVLLMTILMYTSAKRIAKQVNTIWGFAFISCISILEFLSTYFVVDKKVETIFYAILLVLFIMFSISTYKENKKQKLLNKNNK
ncbi:hypothetical protein [Helicovermis profundi]|uniref:NADH dehydrogenase subunit 6 n=1 Tax=Helicovermis profundi TaxID=3065157 RepID=A0AAU9E0Q1_9FIRM|nr:hypothetical protein HLPR_01340 [Clostridia bacterium S502]